MESKFWGDEGFIPYWGCNYNYLLLMDNDNDNYQVTTVGLATGKINMYNIGLTGLKELAICLNGFVGIYDKSHFYPAPANITFAELVADINAAVMSVIEKLPIALADNFTS